MWWKVVSRIVADRRTDPLLRDHRCTKHNKQQQQNMHHTDRQQTAERATASVHASSARRRVTITAWHVAYVHLCMLHAFPRAAVVAVLDVCCFCASVCHLDGDGRSCSHDDSAEEDQRLSHTRHVHDGLEGGRNTNTTAHNQHATSHGASQESALHTRCACMGATRCAGRAAVLTQAELRMHPK